MKHTRGFTLVELLITAGIIAVVLITAATFLVQSQRSQLATVDLSSRNDARAFVSSLLNYDFRIVCYQEGDEPCQIKIDNPDKFDSVIQISYLEDRFGEQMHKMVTWSVKEGNLIRTEQPADSGSDAIDSIVLTKVQFKATHAAQQLLEFEIQREGDPKPIFVNVAVLNEVQGN